MRLAYVLPWPELGGGNKVVFQHAELLAAHGWDVSVLAAGPRPGWFDCTVRYVDYTRGLPELPAQDLVVATFWTTVPLALEFDLGPVAHFCQGYEGTLSHLESQRGAIEAVYNLPLPTLTVTPYLAQMLDRRFGRQSRVVHPPLDELFRPARFPWRRRAASRRPRLVVPGIFEFDVKAVDVGLGAVRRLRDRDLDCRVVRFSVLPLSQAERRIVEPEIYLNSVRAEEIAATLRRCDLLLFPSLAAEGFGLPLLEAMASGVPAVASRIPSTEYFAVDAVPLVPPGDADALADVAEALLRSPREWRRRRRLGLRVAARFRGAAILPGLVDALHWASRCGRPSA